VLIITPKVLKIEIRALNLMKNKQMYPFGYIPVMVNHPITISNDKEVHHFEVAEYLDHDGENCKFCVFEGDEFVASFYPDEHLCLHICQNLTGMDELLDPVFPSGASAFTF
jgi:hypothetical protein